jgi:hypothetical protein
MVTLRNRSNRPKLKKISRLAGINLENGVKGKKLKRPPIKTSVDKRR